MFSSFTFPLEVNSSYSTKLSFIPTPTTVCPYIRHIPPDGNPNHIFWCLPLVLFPILQEGSRSINEQISLVLFLIGKVISGFSHTLSNSTHPLPSDHNSKLAYYIRTFSGLLLINSKIFSKVKIGVSYKNHKLPLPTEQQALVFFKIMIKLTTFCRFLTTFSVCDFLGDLDYLVLLYTSFSVKNS